MRSSIRPEKIRSAATGSLAQIYAMLLPNLLLFLIISVYPVIWAMKYMFFDFDGINPARFIGLGNFIRLFSRDHTFWMTVKNTLVYAGGKILIIIPIAFFIALILNQRRRGNGVMQALIFSPTIMSSAVMSLVFFLLFNAYNGDLNLRLQHLGVISQPINWLGKDFSMLTVILVAVWGGLGNYMVYFLAGLQQVPAELYESAEIDGVNGLQRLVYITIPLLGPVLKIILMLSILAAFQDIQSIMVLTGGGPFETTDVMFLYIYKLYFPLSGDSTLAGSQYGYGAAASFIAALIIGIVTVSYLYLSRKLDEVY